MSLKFSKIPTTANTVLSDLNELLVGFILNGEKWFDRDAEAQHKKRVSEVTSEQYADALGKAQAMAEEFVKWAVKHGYSKQVKGVWWTARAGSLQAAVGYAVDQKKNPTDILVQFTRGPDSGFLGLSAKATKTKGDIGFKNPGVGTIDKSLKTNLKGIVDKEMEDFTKKLKLSPSASQRKVQLRAKANLKALAEAQGQKVLEKLRDELLKRLKKMSQKELQKYIINDWMDATEALPKYIKVTGMGNKAPYSAKAEDPTKNEKLEALAKGPIKLDKNGISSVLISVGSKKIMKMRFKWESQPMATSMKASGDPA